MRKKLEHQFEKSTEKRLIKELIPNSSTNHTRSSVRPHQTRSNLHPDYQKPILVATQELLNNNRLIHTSASLKDQNTMRSGAYF